MAGVVYDSVDERPVDAERAIWQLGDRDRVAFVGDHWEVGRGIDLPSAILGSELVHWDFIGGKLVYLPEIIAEQVAHESKLVPKDCFQKLMISTVKVVKDPEMEER